MGIREAGIEGVTRSKTRTEVAIFARPLFLTNAVGKVAMLVSNNCEISKAERIRGKKVIF